MNIGEQIRKNLRLDIELIATNTIPAIPKPTSRKLS